MDNGQRGTSPSKAHDNASKASWNPQPTTDPKAAIANKPTNKPIDPSSLK